MTTQNHQQCTCFSRAVPPILTLHTFHRQSMALLGLLKRHTNSCVTNVFIMSVIHHSKTYHFLPPAQQVTGLKRDMGRKNLHHCQLKAHIHCSSEFLPCFPMMIRLILFDYPQVSKTVTSTVILGMRCFLLLKYMQVFN